MTNEPNEREKEIAEDIAIDTPLEGYLVGAGQMKQNYEDLVNSIAQALAAARRGLYTEADLKRVQETQIARMRKLYEARVKSLEARDEELVAAARNFLGEASKSMVRIKGGKPSQGYEEARAKLAALVEVKG